MTCQAAVRSLVLGLRAFGFAARTRVRAHPHEQRDRGDGPESQEIAAGLFAIIGVPMVAGVF